MEGEGFLPGVQVAGVEVGGMSEAEAAQALASAWNGSSLDPARRSAHLVR